MEAHAWFIYELIRVAKTAGSCKGLVPANNFKLETVPVRYAQSFWMHVQRASLFQHSRVLTMGVYVVCAVQWWENTFDPDSLVSKTLIFIQEHLQKTCLYLLLRRRVINRPAYQTPFPPDDEKMWKCNLHTRWEPRRSMDAVRVRLEMRCSYNANSRAIVGEIIRRNVRALC